MHLPVHLNLALKLLDFVLYRGMDRGAEKLHHFPCLMNYLTQTLFLSRHRGRDLHHVLYAHEETYSQPQNRSNQFFIHQ